MKTITTEIINGKAIKTIQELEQLQLIRVRRDEQPPGSSIDWVRKYKGAMTKQPLSELDKQLKALRNE